MKKACFAITLLSVSLLGGCGGPKYANGFKEWLAMHLAKNSPTKLAWVKIEKISSGKTEAVFKFTSEIQCVENLYGPGTSVDTAPATAALQKMKDADVPIPQQNEVIKLYNSISILPIFKITTPEGKGIPMSGKAQATLQNDGEWNYELIEVVGGNYKGTKGPTGDWALEGSKDAKEHALAVQEQVAVVVAAADKAIAQARDAQIAEQNKIAEEQKKQAEAAKAEEAVAQALKDEALALCAPGSQLLGRWQGDEASGDIGMRFAANTEVGETIAVTGVLFDPANTQYQKPFDGKLTRTDDPKIPFKLIVSVLSGGGGVKFEGRWDAPAIQNKTVGLLTEKCTYRIDLQLTSQKIYGKLFWGDRAIKGSYVHFQFNKGHAPIGVPQESSSFNTQTQQTTGGEMQKSPPPSPIQFTQFPHAVDTSITSPTTSPFPAQQNTPSGQPQPQNEEKFPEIRTRLLSQTDVQAMTPAQVRYAINEIYARHGLVFKNPSITEVFRSMQWYRPEPSATVSSIERLLSQIESGNLKLLVSVRETKQSTHKTRGQTENNNYQLTAEQIREQMSAIQPLLNQYKAAAKRMDANAMNLYLDEMISNYPSCPMTIFLLMCQAFMFKDIPNATTLYNRLMTEYPDVDNMQAAYTTQYKALMKIAKE